MLMYFHFSEALNRDKINKSTGCTVDASAPQVWEICPSVVKCLVKDGIAQYSYNVCYQKWCIITEFININFCIVTISVYYVWGQFVQAPNTGP